MYTKFVVYIKCKSLYHYDDCIITLEGNRESKACQFIEFSYHSDPQRRKPSLKRVERRNGDIKLMPYQTYNYRSYL